MPARTVVLEKLTKWNGETHADITPGEYTQLTGRAGRRGLDIEGNAVVLWQPGMNPRELAGLASTRTYPLRSSFRPSYNMAVNLVHQYGRHRARELLEQSFAQFQADRAVVGLARQLRKAEDALAGYAEAAKCHLGDFMEYADLRRQISEVEKEASKTRRAERRDEAAVSLERLKKGDVIVVPAGKFAGPAVILDPGLSEHGHRPLVVTATRQSKRLAMPDFPVPVEPVGRIRLPKGFDGRNPHLRKQVADRSGRRSTTCRCPSPGPRLEKASADPAVAEAVSGAPRPDEVPPVPRLRRPRGPRALDRALLQAAARHRDPRPAGRAPDQHRRARVRPGLRGARRASLPRRRPGDRSRSRPDADLLRPRPGRGRGAARGHVGRAVALPARVRAVGPRVRGPSARRVSAARPRRADRRPRSRACNGSGPSSSASRRTTSSPSSGPRTPDSPGPPTAGPRATSSTRSSPAPTSPPATSSGR